MKKKYNNESRLLKDWTNKKLKEMAEEYYDLIYGNNPCYGTKDIIYFDMLADELYLRGIKSKIIFY